MKFRLVLFVLFLAAYADAVGQSNTPSIYFENTSIDVGTVTQGETISRVFPFINKGPGILEILDIGHT